jgi:NAD(P)H-dependent FMN reductase
MIKILVFSGSSRQGNYTQHVAQFMTELLNRTPDVNATLVTPASLNLSFADEGEQAKPSQLTPLVINADAYVAVTPEYNHGYSATIKYMLDLHFKEYHRKPIGLVGVSSGPWGGTRALEALVGSVRKMGLVTSRFDVNVSMVEDEIKEGRFVDPAKWEKRADRMITELLWLAKALKTARETTPATT